MHLRNFEVCCWLSLVRVSQSSVFTQADSKSNTCDVLSVPQGRFTPSPGGHRTPPARHGCGRVLAGCSPQSVPNPGTDSDTWPSLRTNIHCGGTGNQIRSDEPFALMFAPPHEACGMGCVPIPAVSLATRPKPLLFLKSRCFRFPAILTSAEPCPLVRASPACLPLRSAELSVGMPQRFVV